MHRIRSPGAASRSRTASAAAASRTCSQLSRITTAAAPLSRSNSAASPPVTFNAAITVSSTSSAVVAVSSLANQTPPGDSASVRPVAIATAVFPIPPGPTISTSRSPASSSDSAAISVSRPTSSADSDGRFPAARSGARSAGSWFEDLLLELVQSRPGREAELVRQLAPDPLVRRQRVGLASRPVQRGDQQLPQALPGTGGSLRPPPARRPRRRQGAATGPRAGSRRASRAPLRAVCGAGQPSRLAVGSTSPRKRSSAVALSSAAPRSSPASSSSDALAVSLSTAIASTAEGATARLYPPSLLATADGSPNARRNLATLDWSVLRFVTAPPQRSSTSRSVRTSSPASSASRTSNSDVLPPGTGTS